MRSFGTIDRWGLRPGDTLVIRKRRELFGLTPPRETITIEQINHLSIETHVLDSESKVLHKVWENDEVCVELFEIYRAGELFWKRRDL